MAWTDASNFEIEAPKLNDEAILIISWITKDYLPFCGLTVWGSSFVNIVCLIKYQFPSFKIPLNWWWRQFKTCLSHSDNSSSIGDPCATMIEWKESISCKVIKFSIKYSDNIFVCNWWSKTLGYRANVLVWTPNLMNCYQLLSYFRKEETFA